MDDLDGEKAELFGNKINQNKDLWQEQKIY
jgi:hypothetical protein